jgi:hypothetical protein
MAASLSPVPADSAAHLAARLRAAHYGPRTWLRTLHLVADLPIGAVAFTLASTAGSLSAGLALTVVGLPLLVLTLVGARCYARFERGRVRMLLGVRVAPPESGRGGLAPRRWLAELPDGAGWKALAHALLALPVGALSFTVVVTGWVTAFALLGTPLAAPWLPEASRIGSVNIDTPAGAAGAFVAGAVLAGAMPLVVRGLTAVDTVLARLLLGGSPGCEPLA